MGSSSICWLQAMKPLHHQCPSNTFIPLPSCWTYWRGTPTQAPRAARCWSMVRPVGSSTFGASGAAWTGGPLVVCTALCTSPPRLLATSVKPPPSQFLCATARCAAGQRHRTRGEHVCTLVELPPAARCCTRASHVPRAPALPRHIQAITTAALLKLPRDMPKSSKLARVDAVLEELDLERCQVWGAPWGLAGGQRGSPA